MTSPARAAANAANASLSTGPRTEEGKARSSRNAVRHGLTSKQLVIAPGQEEEFDELHDALLEQLAPEGALEMNLFNMLIHAAWNLQRFRTLEAQLVTNDFEALLDDATAKALDRLQRYAASSQRAYFKALTELRTVQNNRLLRRTLEGHENDPVPELVSVGDVTKRTQQLNIMALRAELLSSETIVKAPSPRLLQNEAT